MRYLLNIAYDGAEFNGWQSNPNGRTVQDTIEDALSSLMKKQVRITGASRTDTGVHALDQYAHFDHDKELPHSMLFDGMNSILPCDVRIKGVNPVSSNFHSRFSAIYKIYTYIITAMPVSLPFLSRYSLNIRKSLDYESMEKATGMFAGQKDFSAFRASGCSARSPVITLERAEMIRRMDKIYLVFKARSFLQHMIRNIVGCILYAGLKKIEPDHIKYLFEKKDRRLSPPTAVPNGLFLMKIGY